MPPKIVVVTGPTATGKTRLGIRLCQKFNGEVISADSMQIYKGMDIGTAKPTAAETLGVSHHMIDVADPFDNYSVARYVDEASVCLDDILSRGKLPVIVGGTGLYIDSLVSGRGFAGFEGNPALRRELSSLYAAEGGEKILEKLEAVDPESAKTLHPNDEKRIVRALEVFYSTGIPLSRHNLESKSVPPRYAACKIALDFENRADLYAAINDRVDRMIFTGLYGEYRRLVESGVPLDSTALQAIGYKEFLQAEGEGWSGSALLKTASDRIKLESRRYAKRQLTWLRRDSAVHWIRWETVPDFDKALRLSTLFLEKNGIM